MPAKKEITIDKFKQMSQKNLPTDRENDSIIISYDNIIHLNMSTLSVPLTTELEERITTLVNNGYGVNKADVARKAIDFYAEEMAIKDVLEAEQELKDGKILRGDLDDLLKQVGKLPIPQNSGGDSKNWTKSCKLKLKKKLNYLRRTHLINF
ncbi:MAG: hypothetical protein PHP74_04090 [Candidatus Gracilibacteria bacterium]|nr:hypothetical protein [Candidatus Gracilibacteria bacterium]